MGNDNADYTRVQGVSLWIICLCRLFTVCVGILNTFWAGTVNILVMQEFNSSHDTEYHKYDYDEKMKLPKKIILIILIIVLKNSHYN